MMRENPRAMRPTSQGVGELLFESIVRSYHASEEIAQTQLSSSRSPQRTLLRVPPFEAMPWRTARSLRLVVVVWRTSPLRVVQETVSVVSMV